MLPSFTGCCSLSCRNHVPLLPANSLGCSCAWAAGRTAAKPLHTYAVGGPLEPKALMGEAVG